MLPPPIEAREFLLDCVKTDAARKIDQQITITEAASAPHDASGATPSRQDFQPLRDQSRRKGTGSGHQIGDHTWEVCSPI